jgi:hypothetical protein
MNSLNENINRIKSIMGLKEQQEESAPVINAKEGKNKFFTSIKSFIGRLKKSKPESQEIAQLSTEDLISKIKGEPKDNPKEEVTETNLELQDNGTVNESMVSFIIKAINTNKDKVKSSLKNAIDEKLPFTQTGHEGGEYTVTGGDYFDYIVPDTRFWWGVNWKWTLNSFTLGDFTVVESNGNVLIKVSGVISGKAGYEAGFGWQYIRLSGGTTISLIIPKELLKDPSNKEIRKRIRMYASRPNIWTTSLDLGIIYAQICCGSFLRIYNSVMDVKMDIYLRTIPNWIIDENMETIQNLIGDVVEEGLKSFES